MSELKPCTYDDMIDGDADTNTEYYPKSEADKVIADKDKTIAGLNDKLQNVSELLKETREWLIESQKMHKRCADNAIKKIRHHKYKRCLAMAKECVYGEIKLKRVKIRDMNNHQFWQFDNDYWQRWNERWLKIAEKFKEAK